MRKAAVLLLLASCASPWPLEPDPSPLPLQYQAVSLQEKFLDRIVDVLEPATIRFSPDGRRVGYAFGGGGVRRMVVDGQQGPRFDSVGYLQFTTDGRWAYPGTRGDRSFAVIDGIEHECPGRPDFNFDRDLQKSPFVATVGKKRVVILGGGRSREWDAVSLIRMSDDRRRFAYLARDGNHYHAVIDGSVGEPFDELVSWGAGARINGESGYIQVDPTVSRDGRSIAYPMIKEGKAYMVLDEVKSGPLEHVWPPYFSDRGSRFGYFAVLNGKTRAVIDGRMDELYEVTGWGPMFSPDGRRVAYVGVEGDSQFLVLDGVRGPSYKAIDHITFSPGGRHVAYLANNRDKNGRIQWKGGLLNGFVVLNGREHSEYDAVDGLTFSPDGRRFVYSTRRGDQHIVVVDGQELQFLNRKAAGFVADVFGLSFSPDERHLCWFTYTSEGECALVIDGRIVDRCTQVGSYPGFTPDGRHVVYGALKGRELWWKVFQVR